MKIKNKNLSDKSKKWLKRHLSDKYVKLSKDNSYSKTIYNTVDNTQYSIGGAWSLSQGNTLSLVEANTTKTINASFDHQGPLIPLHAVSYTHLPLPTKA